jgi:ubiquinone/menaquinone biosynthesis C-methylase UbiE
VAGYYDRRAGEYDATAWDSPLGDRVESDRVREVLGTLPPARTLDVGCGTAYVTRWLPGEVTLADASRAMLNMARQRLPRAAAVQVGALALPFRSGSFERAFASNLLGHFRRPDRVVLLGELARVAADVVILDQVAGSGEFEEGPETRRLNDGSVFVIHKCYFTAATLLGEVRTLGAAEVMLDGRTFAIVRATVGSPG